MTEVQSGGHDDAALVRAVVGGSLDALASLYDRHAAADLRGGVPADEGSRSRRRGGPGHVPCPVGSGGVVRPGHGVPRRRGCTRSLATGRSTGCEPPVVVRTWSTSPMAVARCSQRRRPWTARPATDGSSSPGRWPPTHPTPASGQGDAGHDRGGYRRPGSRRADGHRARLPRGTQSNGDRRAARLAAGHGQDPDPARAPSPARRAGGVGERHRARERGREADGSRRRPRSRSTWPRRSRAASTV